MGRDDAAAWAEQDYQGPSEACGTGGEGEGVEVEAPVDVPHYRLAQKDDFEKAWHLAMWAPTPGWPDRPYQHGLADPPGDGRYHQDQYPDVYAEEVQKTVFESFGEVAACKVAHSQKLSRRSRRSSSTRVPAANRPSRSR